MAIALEGVRRRSTERRGCDDYREAASSSDTVSESANTAEKQDQKMRTNSKDGERYRGGDLGSLTQIRAFKNPLCIIAGCSSKFSISTAVSSF